LSKSLRGLPRQVVPDATIDDAVRISAREFLGIGTAVRMRGTVGITLKAAASSRYVDKCQHDDSGRPIPSCNGSALRIVVECSQAGENAGGEGS
jgi:hypothetical protein